MNFPLSVTISMWPVVTLRAAPDSSAVRPGVCHSTHRCFCVASETALDETPGRWPGRGCALCPCTWRWAGCCAWKRAQPLPAPTLGDGFGCALSLIPQPCSVLVFCVTTSIELSPLPQQVAVPSTLLCALPFPCNVPALSPVSRAASSFSVAAQSSGARAAGASWLLPVHGCWCPFQFCICKQGCSDGDCRHILGPFASVS